MAEETNAYTKNKVILKCSSRQEICTKYQKVKGKSKQIREAVIRTDEMEPSHGIRFKERISIKMKKK